MSRVIFTRSYEMCKNVIKWQHWRRTLSHNACAIVDSWQRCRCGAEQEGNKREFGIRTTKTRFFSLVFCSLLSCLECSFRRSKLVVICVLILEILKSYFVYLRHFRLKRITILRRIVNYVHLVNFYIMVVVNCNIMVNAFFSISPILCVS